MLAGMNLLTYLSQEHGRGARLAALTAIAPAFISQISNGVRPCPAEHAAGIERACEFEVRRWDLRPDDWHRIWPELIGTEGAPAVPVVSVEASE